MSPSQFIVVSDFINDKPDILTHSGISPRDGNRKMDPEGETVRRRTNPTPPSLEYFPRSQKHPRWYPFLQGRETKHLEETLTTVEGRFQYRTDFMSHFCSPSLEYRRKFNRK